MKKLIILLAVLLIAIQLFGWDGFGQSRGTNFTQRWMELTDSLTLVNTITEFSVDGTLAGNSDDAVPTEKAVKTYVDGAAGTVIWSKTGTTISPTVAGDDIDGTGGYLLDSQSITNLASKGASYWFDGVDDYADLDLLATELATSTVGTIVWNGVFHDLSTDYSQHYCFSDASAATFLALLTSGIANDEIYFELRNAASSIWRLAVDTKLSEDIQYNIVLVQDGIEPVVYINGNLISTTLTETTDKSYWFSDVSGWDTCRLGCREYASSPKALFANDTVNQFYAFNTALTADEVKDIYSGKELPYKYIGASQTALNVSNCVNSTGVPYDDGAGGGFSNGTPTGFDAVSNGTGTQIARTADEIAFVLGKTYRIYFDLVLNSGTAPFYQAFEVPDVGTTGLGSGAVASSAGANMTEFVCTKTATGGVSIYNASTASNYEITNLSITQIGNVANYSSDGVGHNTWSDTSGNNLYGTVSGAKAINMKYQQDIIRQDTITDDTQILSSSNIVPAGYMLKYMFGLETAGNTATLDLGTSAGGSQVFSQQAFTASTETCVDIGILFSRTADTALYLNDDGVGTWNSGSLNVIFVLERVQ